MEIEGHKSNNHNAELSSCSFLAPTYFPPSTGDNGSCDDEEELTVLPRHTKVVVRGNNRTKSILVGLEGVVKKAVGLGGWHWLVLTNGVEVKLQRNALTVVEPPTGNEVDDEDDIAMNFPTDPQTADDFPTMFKPRIKSSMVKAAPSAGGAGAAPGAESTTTTKESSRPTIESSPTTKESVTTTMVAMAKKETIKPLRDSLVDLSKLQTSALRRYRKHFKLCDVGPSSSKEQLLHSIGKHFLSHHLDDELKIINGFLHAAKRVRT